ncbi:MAG TPA: right-handed parallel beta-helix repeat-containing protein [Candidatus Limnocylindrales bacterium]|nr:right-handed parallel beta-helix repeat-containing protein [Candidatus Limnocylindrales bacterium]
MLRVGFLLCAWASLSYGQIYVSPSGDDAATGTQAHPIRTLEHARDLIRSRIPQMTADLTVHLASGTYRLGRPLVLDARDSGSAGHNVVWAGDSGAIVSGGVRLTGWKLMDRARNVWTAASPADLDNTRQMWVDGVRAHRASGRLPVSVTMTATGYTASSDLMSYWKNVSGIEFVYTGGNNIWSEHEEGLGGWTEPRCPVALIQGTAITMAQPCWDNSTKRIMLPSGARTANLVGPASVGKQPAYIENAFELLGRPGEFYFDLAAHTFYYVPRPGEDLTKADLEAARLETLVSLQGGANAPVHNIQFTGIQFSYGTYLQPSGPEGFSEIQANYTLTGQDAWAKQGLCTLVPGGECPYGAWTKMPANVTVRYGHNVQFRNDAFIHLGAAGLDLGDGAQGNSAEGCVFTDVSGNGVELGAVDKPEATGNEITRDNRIRNNHFWNIGAEYHDGIAIVVGYAQNSRIEHNQIDHTPYAAISMGWGGWPDKIQKAGVSNYSHDNLVANNRISNFMLVLADGGGIYTQGLTGPDLAHGEKVTGNIVTDQFGSGHGIYTDNGSCNITVEGNIMFHTNFDNWGSRHKDYYDGQDGSKNDPLLIRGNWWQQDANDVSRDNVTVAGNHLMLTMADAPAALVDAAGLEKQYRPLLARKFGPPVPPEPPSRVAAFAGNGWALVTFSPPVFEGGAPVDAYTVTASSGATATISAADFWRIGYVRIDGLKNGTEYTFSATARNAAGLGGVSLPSHPVTPENQPIPLPAAPARVTASADASGRVSVHFQDPAAVDKKAPGAPVIAYDITVDGQTVRFTGRNVLALQTTTHTTFTTVSGAKSGEHTVSVAAVNPTGVGTPATVTIKAK